MAWYFVRSCWLLRSRLKGLVGCWDPVCLRVLVAVISGWFKFPIDSSEAVSAECWSSSPTHVMAVGPDVWHFGALDHLYLSVGHLHPRIFLRRGPMCGFWKHWIISIWVVLVRSVCYLLSTGLGFMCSSVADVEHWTIFSCAKFFVVAIVIASEWFLLSYVCWPGESVLIKFFCRASLSLFDSDTVVFSCWP